MAVAGPVMLEDMNETEDRQDDAEDPQSESQVPPDTIAGGQGPLPLGFVPV